MSTTLSEVKTPVADGTTVDRPDARRRKGQITREQILSVATRLLAEHGYNGVALRQVCIEAKVNLALMSYHFGTKQQLLQEIFQRGTRYTNQHREENLARLEEAKAAGNEPSLEEILTAFVNPSLERDAKDDDPDELNFLKLSGRLATDPTPEVRQVMGGVYDVVAIRFVNLLRPACPQLSDSEFFMRLVFFYGVMLYTRADTGRVRALTDQMKIEIPASNGSRTCKLMIPFLAAGFRAPASEPADSAKPAKRPSAKRK